EELQDFDRFVTAGGDYQIGGIRPRRGDFAAARDADRTPNEPGRSPQPRLALLQLAAGQGESAQARVDRGLGEIQEPLARVRALPALVEIALAAADLATARSAAAELQRLVDSYKIGDRRAPAFDATVHFGLGQIALTEKDWDGAARDLQCARDGWHQIGAPYEVAQTRLLLGIAFRHQGDEHGATLELQAALTTFERLGAKLDE